MSIENPLKQEQNPEQPEQKKENDSIKDPSRRDFLKKAGKLAAGAAAFAVAGKTLSPDTAFGKEKKAAPKPETAGKENIADSVLSPEQIKEIEKAGGKIEYNRNGALVLSQPDSIALSSQSTLKNTLTKIIDFSKYDYQAIGGGHNGPSMCYFITDKALTTERSMRNFPGTVSFQLSNSEIEEKYGADIEINTGNFVSIFQGKEENQQYGNALEYLKKNFDPKHYSVKNVELEKGIRIFITKLPDKKNPAELKQ